MGTNGLKKAGPINPIGPFYGPKLNGLLTFIRPETGLPGGPKLAGLLMSAGSKWVGLLLISRPLMGRLLTISRLLMGQLVYTKQARCGPTCLVLKGPIWPNRRLDGPTR